MSSRQVTSYPPAELPPDSPAAGASTLAGDVAVAVRNSIKLGASLVGTWAVALVVRIVLPRHLGPALFGSFSFADSFTAAVVVVSSLGLDTYIRRELPTRPQHATDFFGGTLILRLVLSAVALAAANWALTQAGKSSEVRWLVLILGAAQLLMIVNLTFGAILHSVGTVGALSVVNVASKAAWGVGIALAFAVGGGVLAVGVAMLVSEILRTITLGIITRRQTSLRWRIQPAASVAVLIASLPFYLTTLAQTVYSRVDVSVMAFLTTDVEVGWYGAASNVASLSLLLSPLIGWIILPLSSRAAARSDAELTLVARRAMDLTLAVAFPLSLVLGLGADTVIRVAFGSAYAPAARSLRVLAPTFVFIYVGMVSASLLVRTGRAWALTWISVAGMAAAAALNVLLIPWGGRLFGVGGAGVGAAAALVITELLTAVAMTWLLRWRAFERGGLIRAGKTTVICAAVVGLHVAVPALGQWRLALDGVAYLGLTAAWGAVDLEGLRALARLAIGRSRTLGQTNAGGG